MVVYCKPDGNLAIKVGGGGRVIAAAVLMKLALLSLFVTVDIWTRHTERKRGVYHAIIVLVSEYFELHTTSALQFDYQV